MLLLLLCYYFPMKLQNVASKQCTVTQGNLDTHTKKNVYLFLLSEAICMRESMNGLWLELQQPKIFHIGERT